VQSGVALADWGNIALSLPLLIAVFVQRSLLDQRERVRTRVEEVLPVQLVGLSGQLALVREAAVGDPADEVFVAVGDETVGRIDLAPPAAARRGRARR
jgi:hypothetical protein